MRMTAGSERGPHHELLSLRDAPRAADGLSCAALAKPQAPRGSDEPPYGERRATKITSTVLGERGLSEAAGSEEMPFDTVRFALQDSGCRPALPRLSGGMATIASECSSSAIRRNPNGGLRMPGMPRDEGRKRAGPKSTTSPDGSKRLGHFDSQAVAGGGTTPPSTSVLSLRNDDASFRPLGSSRPDRAEDDGCVASCARNPAAAAVAGLLRSRPARSTGADRPGYPEAP